MDLDDLDAFAWAALLARAAELGAADAMAKAKPCTAKQILPRLGVSHYRVAHGRFLQRAYMAGRWHAEICILNTPNDQRER